MIDGRIQNVLPDAGTDGETNDLPVTHESDIGSYIAVTLKRHDGRPLGTLCCLSHTRDPWFRDRDLGLMQRLAQRVVARLEKQGVLQGFGLSPVSKAFEKGLRGGLEF